jgi:hypothetical protein
MNNRRRLGGAKRETMVETGYGPGHSDTLRAREERCLIARDFDALPGGFRLD